MGLEANLQRRIDRAFKTLENLGVPKSDCIVVGSSVVAMISDRIPGDVDIAVRPTTYQTLLKNFNVKSKLIVSSGTIDLDDDFQILQNRYADVRVDDALLFDEPNYQKYLGGYYFAAPELEMAKKIKRNYDKDFLDVSRFLQWAENCSDWNWEILALSKPHTRKELLRKGLKRLISNPRQLYRRLKNRLVEKLGEGFFDYTSTFNLPVNSIDLGILIQLQIKDRCFSRYDVLVRKQVADMYYENTENGLKIDRQDKSLRQYEKMQSQRVARGTTDRFLRLLNSVGETGYDSARFPIYLNRKGNIYDGSHRVAIALSLGVYNVPVRFNRFLSVEPQYGKSWFESRFDASVIENLSYAEQDVLVRSGAAFQLMIWPPANHLFSEIVSFISDKTRLVSCDKDIEIKSFRDFSYDIYRRDGIAKWKIARKIQFMDNYDSKISLISVIIDNPRYRKNRSNGVFLSDTIAEIKASIRSQFKGAFPEYFGDFICHSGDNPQMNREILSVIDDYRIPRDIEGGANEA